MAITSEGYLNVEGHQFFYRSFGEPSKGTVLCLHGGPGATHDYMLSLTDLTEFGYRVIFYDQLGCGKSDVPKNTALFTVERAVEEVEIMRKALKLAKINLVGSSWGGMLAIAYALQYQKNLKSMVTIGGLASVPRTTAEMQKMKSQLPDDVQAVMRKYEETGDYENPKYLKAVEVFYRKHLCRLNEWPKELVYSLDHISKPVYLTMNGPNEFTIIGNIRYWDVTHLLHKIHVPTLITGGKFDEVSPVEARSIHRGIKGSRLVTFQKSSHLPMWEERERFMTVVRKFLDGVN
ncbi:MAG TPA: proline iminopeptidase-family hydrolase [Methylomirabilota bacterium]|nr:proline iminopeptidase-family hydrolase [Methylomirabilota bacterium]